MSKLHPKSIKLMERVSERFDDPMFMGRMKKRIVDEIYTFYFGTPTEELKKMLLAKMEKGAAEHGEPKYDAERIKKEKQEEMLDILGWDFTGEELDNG